MAKLEWYEVNESWETPAQPSGYRYRTYRARLKNVGWLVTIWAGVGNVQTFGGGLTFVPDRDGTLWPEKPKRKRARPGK